MSFPFRYHLGLKGIEVKLGPFTVRRISYLDIEAVTEGLKHVTLSSKSGWFKKFKIALPHGDFLKELRARLRPKDFGWPR